MAGVSAPLTYMPDFAAAWPDTEIWQQVLPKLPWGQNLLLLDRLSDAETRLWYARKCIEHGWSRSILALHIERRDDERRGRAVTNFERTLPPGDSDMAAQIFKDPYLFDFLGTADPRREREVEQALVDHIQRFLLELGVGFAFVGRQVPLELGDQDFIVDLLFYHLKLRAFVVIELKAVPFMASGRFAPSPGPWRHSSALRAAGWHQRFAPEHAGQLNFYLSAVDELLRHPDDKPTIGLLLCKQKDRILVEYALRDVKKPIGVAQWETRLVESLPKELEGSLPTVEEIEAELGGAR